MVGMTVSTGRNGAAIRFGVVLAVIGGLALALALALPPAAQAQPCGKARKANNVRAFGVSCRKAKRVVAENVSRNGCRDRCSFRKVGYRWSCEQRPSGLVGCEYRFGTSRYTVTFKYTG
jgi:hypothetical protein